MIFVTTIIFLLTVIIALNNNIVYTWFNKIPLFFCGVIGGLYLIKLIYKKSEKRVFKIIFVTLITCSVISGINIFFNLINPRQMHQEFTSPDKEKTVVIEKDILDRPIIYEREGIFMKKIYKGDKYYNQTVFYEIIWIDNNNIELVNSSMPNEAPIKIVLP